MKKEFSQEETARLQSLSFTHDEDRDFVVLETVNGIQEYSDCLSEGFVQDLGFCGCACHDESIEFMLVQLAGLAEGKNYFHLHGGYEFFKLGCYEFGLLDENQELTASGKVLAELGRKITDTEITLPNYVFGHKLDFREDELKTNVFSILTDRTNNPVPEWINKDRLLEALHYFMKGLDRGMAASKEEESVIYNYRNKHGGECTLLLYWLDGVLELEEHGMSTPGWICQGSEFKWKALKDAIKGYDKYTQDLTVPGNPNGELGPDLDWDIINGKPTYLGYNGKSQ